MDVLISFLTFVGLLTVSAGFVLSVAVLANWIFK